MVPVEEDDSEENDTILCEVVVEAAEIVPIMSMNQASKTVEEKKRRRGRKHLAPENFAKVKIVKEQK